MATKSKLLSTDSYERISVALYKPSILEPPERLSMAYILEGKAYYMEAPVIMPYATTPPKQLMSARDISICWETRWRATYDGKYLMFTPDRLFIAYVDHNNDLWFKNGITGAPTLISSGVSKCAIIRGWKHITDESIDQGICLVYIKRGQAYLQQCIPIQGKYAWEVAQKIAYSGYVHDVDIKRTNDYRISILLQGDIGNSLVLTERTFPGTAIKNEYLDAVKFSAQTSGEIFTVKQSEHLLSTDNFNVFKLGTSSAGKVGIIAGYRIFGWNLSSDYIILNFTFDVVVNEEALFAGLTMQDINGTVCIVNSYTRLTDSSFKIDTLNLINCFEKLDITIIGAGIKDIEGKAVPDLVGEIALKGYTPVPPKPPTLISTTNIAEEIL